MIFYMGPSSVNWEVESELWELMMIHSTDDWQKYMQAALERGWPLAFLVQIRDMLVTCCIVVFVLFFFKLPKAC